MTPRVKPHFRLAAFHFCLALSKRDVRNHVARSFTPRLQLNKVEITLRRVVDKRRSVLPKSEMGPVLYNVGRSLRLTSFWNSGSSCRQSRSVSLAAQSQLL